MMQDAFKQLDQAVEAAVDDLKRLRQENRSLRLRLEALQEELKQANSDKENIRRLVERYRDERSQMRSRLAGVLEKIAGLRKPADKSTLQV